MADEFVVLQEDTWVERRLPGSKDRTTRVLLGRAGTRVHRSRLPRGHIAVEGDVEAAEELYDQLAGTAPADEGTGGDEDAAGAPGTDGEGDTPGGAPSDERGPATDATAAALPEAPARNATTEAWRDYALAVEQATSGEDGPSVERTDAIMDASRDDLVAAYHPDGPAPADEG